MKTVLRLLDGLVNISIGICLMLIPACAITATFVAVATFMDWDGSDAKHKYFACLVALITTLIAAWFAGENKE